MHMARFEMKRWAAVLLAAVSVFALAGVVIAVKSCLNPEGGA